MIPTFEVVLPSSGLGDVPFCCAIIIPPLEEQYKFEIFALESQLFFFFFPQVHIYYLCFTILLWHGYISYVLAPPPSALLLWFNPSCQLNTTQPLSHSLQCDEGENQEGKTEKAHGLR